MPLDALTVHALTDELAISITGGRIDKIQQPERDLLLVSLRASGENKKLLISAAAGSARVHLTEKSFENPSSAPLFCMLLRKHLVGAHIVSVTQPAWERMIEIVLDGRDELGFETRKRLIIELIGRSSNVILVGEDDRIIDCIRRMDYAGDAFRRLLPGMIYRYPPKQDKPCFFESDSEERRIMLNGADRTRPVDKWLLDSFAGLSPMICRELSYRSGGEFERLGAAMDAFFDSVENCELVPYILESDGKPTEFSCIPINQYGASVEGMYLDSYSALLDTFYSRRDAAEIRRRRGSELCRTVRTLRDRTSKKLYSRYEELKRTDERENLRIKAELVTANIYRLRKGNHILECENYYEPDNPKVEIELDPLKTPQQNAASMYKKYNKLKTAREHLTVLVAEDEKQLEYLNSVLDEISRAESERDISDIRRELIEGGFIKKQRGSKPDRSKTQEPRRFMSDDGLEILVGRNNVQNDELTTRLARRTDYWLHTQSVHGSHVILRCDGLEPPKNSIQQAAALAVYYSQARDGGKTAVDYTMVRFVRKPSGALPGKVIYTDYKTLITEADEELVNRLATRKLSSGNV